MKFKKKGKTQNYIIIGSIAVSAMLIIIYPFFSIRFTDSRMTCFPYKVWFIDKTDKEPGIGDFIAFRTPQKAVYVPEHKVWIKRVFAAGEGQIDVTPADSNTSVCAEINGVNRELPVKAYVRVTSGMNQQFFTAFAADSLGRPLPIINSQVIPSGYYYTYSPAVRSYDSRYWGLVRKDEILGKAHPLY